ncbi:MAG TPA: hydantoinase B/oxoprolinase family protein, partial [Thermoleophilaceae bacterium]
GLAEGAMGMPPSMAVVSGVDERFDDAPYVNQLFLGSAGGPASPEADGWPTYLLPVCASLVYKDSVEVDEQRYPIHVFEQRLLPDTEGSGRRRGGLGCRVSYGPKAGPVTIAYSVEAHHNPPRGVRGGHDGQPTNVWKQDARGERVEVPLVGAIELAPGERIVSISSGGGGYGNPLERAPALVLADVLEGWVSRERALAVYGVVIGGDDTVDEQATTERREATRAADR